MKKLRLRLPTRSYQTIRDASIRSDLTMSDVYGIAHGLFLIAEEEHQLGHSLAIVDRSGRVLKDLVIPQFT